ncbi:MAG: UvrD-helicase domain-containing protein, partial [Candidatus Nomurabacteria bacterium]|nr:UvrD-helicase domain-containing protein [Candidatus Nomurabacteria bacterium]
MFDREYDKLNEQQKLAVDTTEGPVLVIAGPGTGKTQLLGLRVANILGQDNGALAENVLCLTFTEAGAANMRERLLRFIGSEAYKVTISTYHGFGQSIIGENPEYFAAQNLQKPIDELGTYQVLAEILENLPMGDINKNYFRDRLGVYAGVTHDLKKSLITPDDLREIAKKNLQDNDTFDSLAADLPAKMPSKVVAAVGIFDDFLSKLQLHPESTKEGRLLCLATKELSSALDGITKTTPLTDWKNKWLVRNNRDKGVLRNSILNKRLTSLAQIYAEYNRILRERGLYDFADMILQTIRALQENDDLRFSLQERYQYILLDEYQDTNP